MPSSSSGSWLTRRRHEPNPPWIANRMPPRDVALVPAVVLYRAETGLSGSLPDEWILSGRCDNRPASFAGHRPAGYPATTDNLTLSQVHATI